MSNFNVRADHGNGTEAFSKLMGSFDLSSIFIMLYHKLKSHPFVIASSLTHRRN